MKENVFLFCYSTYLNVNSIFYYLNLLFKCIRMIFLYVEIQWTCHDTDQLSTYNFSLSSRMQGGKRSGLQRLRSQNSERCAMPELG